MTHTPGTWTSDHGTRSSWVHLGDKDDGRVVEVKGDNHQNDADFIAEAPAMLDALRFFLGGDDKVQVGVGGNPTYVDRKLDEARAILARIGETE
jgi:hypothetical protein